MFFAWLFYCSPVLNLAKNNRFKKCWLNPFMKVPDWGLLGIRSPLSDLLFTPISSAEHNMFVCDLFWKWDPFVLTDACSGAVAKAQLDFLDCHARLLIYPLLSDKQKCSFVTLRNNYFPRRHTTLNLFCLEPDTDMAVRQEVGWSVNPKMQLCYSNKPGLLEYLLD